MPTYDYICTECKQATEKFQKITDEPLKTCPVCHKNTLKRSFIGGNNPLIFKGSGYYITDYKKENTKPEPSSSKTSKTKA